MATEREKLFTRLQVQARGIVAELEELADDIEDGINSLPDNLRQTEAAIKNGDRMAGVRDCIYSLEEFTDYDWQNP